MPSDKPKKEAEENYKLVTEKYDAGETCAAEIARQTGIPPRTVSRYIEKWKDRTPIDEIRTIGSQTKITPQLHSFIGSEIEKDPFITAKGLQERLAEKKGVEVRHPSKAGDGADNPESSSGNKLH